MTRVASVSEAALQEAAEALRQGRLVVFPTETVYGLGANALDESAVRAIFAAKGRPVDNPLIVHVADTAAARSLATAWPEEAQRLADSFWPGPLTLVLPRAASVPDATTAGLDSVALRVPAHPVAQALLRATGLPLAAPSANRSGRPSPTRAVDALADVGGAVALVLDGGPTDIGLESTVVSFMGPRPALLRLGALPRERIEEVLGAPLDVAGGDDARRSPGTRHRHYAPKARLLVVRPKQVLREAESLRAAGLRVALVVSRESGITGEHVRVPGGRHEADAWARALFALLRDLDGLGYHAIVVESIPEDGLGATVMDRLRRAAEASGLDGDQKG